MNVLEVAVAEQQADPQVTYSEGVITVASHPKYGPIPARRMDRATGLPSLDAPAPHQEPPEGGWGDDVFESDGRPVKPLDSAICQVVTAENRARAMRESVRTRSATPRPAVRRMSGARPRERRYRRARRTRQASRDGPSDDSQGDGEASPPPAATPLNARPSAGFSNSLGADAACPPWRVGEVGIDTAAFGWRDPLAAAALRVHAREREVTRYDWNGRHMRLAVPVGGIVLGACPTSGLVTAEARLAAMLAGHTDDHRLTAPELLAAGAMRAEAAFQSLGIELEGPAVCRRVDPASELLSRDGYAGLAFLAACERCLQLPRLKQAPIHAQGDARLECIEWRTASGKRVRLRLYDAGVRHGTHPPGQRLRLELEQRWSGKQTPAVGAVTREYLAARFRAPLERWLRQSVEVEVATPSEANRALFDLAREGTITPRRARSLSASVSSLVYALDLSTPHDRRRRQAELRKVGLVLDQVGDPESTWIDLLAPLAALLVPWERADAA